ncbi:MAG: sigma-70 family RNA polymerase sigma factor [Phycisphaerales bacterium JB063]
MERIAKGDAAALRALYEQLGPLLLAMGCRVLHDRQLAEDVLNEVFLELWKKPDKYDATRSSPRTFLILVMRRRSIDRLRSRKAGVQTVGYERSDTSNHTANRPGPADRLAAAEERDQVRAVLDALPEEQRRAIEMSFFDGKTNVEIADETGVPLGTIKGRIRLGLIRLRKSLRTSIGKEDGLE